ncbi:MAG: flagellar basal body-associated FliL family protein [Firmicutes bacterium]|nr:flagellar basal body-associated FliL family protein [Bacillota bacterium]
MSNGVRNTGGKWQRLLMITLLALCLVLGGVYGTIRYMALHANPADPPPLGPMYDLEPFYVNLGGGQSRNTLKIVLALNLTRSKVEKEIEKHEPIIRDEIISVLRGKNASELQEQCNYQELKTELKNRLNRILPDEYINAVYFTEFLISH